MKKRTVSYILLLLLVSTSSLDAQIWVGIKNNTLEFFTLNKLGHKKIDSVVNGLRVSGVYNRENVRGGVLDEATQMPVWNSSNIEYSFGGEISVVMNPLIIDIGAVYSEVLLEDYDLRFGMPPPRPESEWDESIESINYYAAASYIPAAFFWGYVYPSIGVLFYGGLHTFQNTLSFTFSAGAEVRLNVKYSILFVSASFRKFFLDAESYDHQLQANAGIWINL